MTSQRCRQCLSRNWVIYRDLSLLVIRCGDCDVVQWEAMITKGEPDD